MAGVRTNKDGAAYGLQGLFASSEAACWDMHGFNRLGGNSLADTIMAGKIVGEKIAEFLDGYETRFSTSSVKDSVSNVRGKIDRLLSGKNGDENVFNIRNAIQDQLGILRRKMGWSAVKHLFRFDS
jgi:fumarate reductase flavoprotein subunit